MEIDIRHGQEQDLAQLNELYNHYVTETSITFDLEPVTMAKRLEWFKKFDPSGRHQLLVAVRGEQLLGFANSSKFREKAAYQTSVETTIYLHPQAHTKGLGTRLYEALFERLAEQDVHRAFAGITQPNEASVALHKKFGFSYLGTFAEVGRKFERYWDVQWFEKPLG